MPALKVPKAFRMKPWDKTLIEASLTNINAWTEGYFDITLLPWQQYFFHYPGPGYEPLKDKMAVAGIRVGKSFMVGVAALNFCQLHPGALYLNACISSEQAKIVYYTCVELASKPRFQHWVESIERSPYPTIKLTNGAEMWFRSTGYEAELLRGFEFDFISLDECSYISSSMTVDTLKGRLLGVNRETKTTREGWFWQLSSPKGKNGWTFERWKKGDPAYPSEYDGKKFLSSRIRTTDNKYLSEEQINDLMASYSEAMIRQELLGEFVESDNLEFSYDAVIEATQDTHPEVREIQEGIKIWREQEDRRKRSKGIQVFTFNQMEITHYEMDPIPGHRYLAGWDLGKKSNEKGRNATVGMCWDITELPWKLVAYRYETGQPYIKSLDQVEEWHEKYAQYGARIHSMIDATGKGDVVNEVALERGLKLDPLEFTGSNKPDIIAAGRIAFERGRLRLPFIRRVVDELATYERYDKDLAQDNVMTLCMCMYRIHDILGMKLAIDRPVGIYTGQQQRNRRSSIYVPGSRYHRMRRSAHS
jgi:hypothetical protein